VHGKSPEETKVNPPFPVADGIVNQTRKLANAELFPAADRARLNTGTILPVYGR